MGNLLPSVDDTTHRFPQVILDALKSSFAAITNGSLGIEKTDPSNARIYIGSGTGTLTDNGKMGLKVKVDTPDGSRNDGIQSEVKVTTASASGSVRSILGRVTVDDSSTSTGDSVGVWGDAWVTAPSVRNTWGGNIYGSIRPGVAYGGAMLGLEVGAENYGTQDNVGGALNVVGKSTGARHAFGVMIGSDPNADGTANAIAGALKTNLLMRTDRAPSENYVYIGPATANAPSGTAVFQITSAGVMNMGGTLSGTSPVIQIQRSTNTVPTMRLGASSGTAIELGNGSSVPDVTLRRAGQALAALGPALQVGDAVGSGSSYLQLFEQTVDPSVAGTDAARVFVRPNPSTPTKSQLCVRFQTGNAVVIASEA